MQIPKTINTKNTYYVRCSECFRVMDSDLTEKERSKRIELVNKKKIFNSSNLRKVEVICLKCLYNT